MHDTARHAAAPGMVGRIATAMLSRLHRRTSCGACYRRLTQAEPVRNRYSPFGGLPDFTLCTACHEHNAVDEHHVVYTLRSRDMGQFPPPVDQFMTEIEMIEEAIPDWVPIHVYSSGQYLLLRKWLGSPAHEAAIAAYVKHPGHAHLNLDPYRYYSGASDTAVPSHG